MTVVKDWDMGKRGKRKESDLWFDFSDCTDEDVTYLDFQPELQGIPSLDFAVCTPREHALLVEVKDPSQPGARPEQQRQFLASMMSTKLYDDQLVTGGGHSLAFMLAHKPPRQYYQLLAVFGLSRIPAADFDRNLLLAFTDYVNKQLRSQPAPLSLLRANLLTEDGWNQAITEYPLRRVSDGYLPPGAAS